MLCIIGAFPEQEMEIILFADQEAKIEVSRERMFYDNYMEKLTSLMLSHKIDKVGLVGPIPYIFKIAEEIKIKYPSLPIDGEGINQDGDILKFNIEEIKQ